MRPTWNRNATWTVLAAVSVAIAAVTLFPDRPAADLDVTRQEFLAQPESEQQRTLERYFVAAQLPCGSVERLFPQYKAPDHNFLSVRCNSGASYAIAMHEIGSVGTGIQATPCWKTNGYPCFQALGKQ